MTTVDIRLPKSFFVSRKSGSNVAGLIPSANETRSLMEWVNERITEEDLVLLTWLNTNVTAANPSFIPGAYADNAAATTAGLAVGTVYYNTTTGYLAAVTA